MEFSCLVVPWAKQRWFTDYSPCEFVSNQLPMAHRSSVFQKYADVVSFQLFVYSIDLHVYVQYCLFRNQEVNSGSRYRQFDVSNVE
jgi:hypothetical protein